MNGNKDCLAVNCRLFNFLVTKHSWKGRYKRIFSVGTDGLATYNPCSAEATNLWPYNSLICIKPVSRTNVQCAEFLLSVKGKNKVDTLKFSSDYTAVILSQVKKLLSGRGYQADVADMQWNAKKYHWSGALVPVVLLAKSYALLQLDPATGRQIAEYLYMDIVEFVKVSDVAGGFFFTHGHSRRLHMFACPDRDNLVEQVKQRALENIGVVCKLSTHCASLELFQTKRLGNYSDRDLSSLIEFQVDKISPRHLKSVSRIFCISETCVVERDFASYAVTHLHPLKDTHSLVRSESDPHLFQIECVYGTLKTYKSCDRDNILAALLDGVRAEGNVDVHVQMLPTDMALRIVPLNHVLDEECETQLLKFIISSSSREALLEAIGQFNVNIPYGGLLHSVSQEGLFSANKEKMIVNCLLTIVDVDVKLEPASWESVYQALRRLFASKAGFHAFTNVPRLREKLGNLIVTALELTNEAVHHAAIESLCALMQPMHHSFELRQEQLNKSSLLSSKKFLENLVGVLITHVERGTGTLVVISLLDFLTYALCEPYSETTLSEQFNQILELVANIGRTFYTLFQSPTIAVVKGASLVMRAVIEEAEPTVSGRLQEYALSEGAFVRHLYTACFTASSDIRLMTIRQLSRQLVALWAADNTKAKELLQRILNQRQVLKLIKFY